MNLLRKFPVAGALSVVGVLAGAEQLAEGEGLLHGAAAGWVKLAIFIVGGVLGVFAHNASTSLAAPKAADGTPLVPDPGAR